MHRVTVPGRQRPSSWNTQRERPRDGIDKFMFGLTISVVGPLISLGYFFTLTLC